VFALIATATAAYLFRTKKIERRDGSTIWLEFSFGEPTRLRADSSGDGLVDLIASLETDGGILVNREVWLDRDADSRFEFHFVPGRESEFLAEIDSSGDGNYDIRLHGDEARDLYCRWLPCG